MQLAGVDLGLCWLGRWWAEEKGAERVRETLREDGGKVGEECGNFGPTLLLGRRKELEGEFNHLGQWFDQSCLCNKSSIKTQKDGVQKVSTFMGMWKFGKSGALRKGMEALCPFP